MQRLLTSGSQEKCSDKFYMTSSWHLTSIFQVLYRRDAFYRDQEVQSLRRKVRRPGRYQCKSKRRVIETWEDSYLKSNITCSELFLSQSYPFTLSKDLFYICNCITIKSIVLVPY